MPYARALWSVHIHITGSTLQLLLMHHRAAGRGFAQLPLICHCSSLVSATTSPADTCIYDGMTF